MYELNEPFNLTGLYPKRQLCQEPTNFISVSRCFWLMPVLQHQQRAKQNPDRGVKFLMSKFGCLKKKWENHFIFVFECSRSVPFPGIQCLSKIYAFFRCVRISFPTFRARSGRASNCTFSTSPEIDFSIFRSPSPTLTWRRYGWLKIRYVKLCRTTSTAKKFC